MHAEAIVLLGAARTPMGAFCGVLSPLSACQLGSVAIGAALTRSGVAAQDIDEVLMGCVLPAGLGQAPARQASLGAGLPIGVGATTVNKMCGSGLKSVMLGHDMIRGGSVRLVVAGGMESMSNAPHLLPGSRSGWRMGPAGLKDHMFLDGLEDAYETGKLMGVFADRCARSYEFSRSVQDDYALRSLSRTLQAQADGSFAGEIVPVAIKTRTGEQMVDTDEPPARALPDKIPYLQPAFGVDGTVTAANASSIADGAAAVVLAGLGEADKRGIEPLARIVGHASFAHAPDWFTTAPVGAIRQLMTRVGWSLDDVDLFEINEAFAVVVLAAMQELNLPVEKVNVHGGACALGHPIGASGARILVTLLSALRERGLKRGVASLCIGGGEAVAVAVELWS